MIFDSRSGAGILPVPRTRYIAVVSRVVLFGAVFGLSLAMACVRLIEAPLNPLGLLRVAVSLAAFALVLCARRRNVVKRVLFAFALEVVGGVATFVYIDAPFVTRHADQIAEAVSSGYARVTHRDIIADARALHFAP